LFQPQFCEKSKKIIDKAAVEKPRSLYLRMQKTPNSETKVNKDSWSFHSMVEYGRVTREMHKQNL
jgi:hypothetical protein